MSRQKIIPYKTITAIICISFLVNCANEKPKKVQPRKIYNCLLDKITKSDTLFVENSYDGCFGGDTNLIKIFYKNDTLFASMNYDVYENNYPLLEVMSDSSLILYKQFEEKCIYSDDFINMCTTTNRYSVRVKNQKHEFVEGTCTFDLFDRFLNATFTLPKVE